MKNFYLNCAATKRSIVSDNQPGNDGQNMSVISVVMVMLESHRLKNSAGYPGSYNPAIVTNKEAHLIYGKKRDQTNFVLLTRQMNV